MSFTLSAWDHKRWSGCGLKDYGDFAECVTECCQEEWSDHTTGRWFYIPDEPLVVNEGAFRTTYRIIYSGSWGNDNAPGASSYTYAEFFDVDDADDLAEFEQAKQRWESQPEWLDAQCPKCDGECERSEHCDLCDGSGRVDADAAAAWVLEEMPDE